MKFIGIIFFIVFALNSNAQNYACNKIVEGLLKNAKAIKRSEEFKISIKSISDVSIFHKWAITILNEDGNKFAQYYRSYDKYHFKPSVTGTLYDANGKEIRSLKKRDLIDHAVIDGLSLASDARVLKYNFEWSQYPYTVEFEEYQDMNQSFYFPQWFPVEGADFAIEQSKFIVETPSDYKLRYKEINMPQKANVSTSKKTIYEWELKNIKPFQYEILQPSFSQFFPDVVIAASDFQVGGYKGSMNTWKEYGQFIYDLYKDRDVLPDNVKKDVHALTDAITDQKEKVKILYQYLQNSTHYILILLGMGGWQPLDATFVADKKYGDCKALSNYMVALLNEAKIKANVVLVLAGEKHEDLYEDFSSNRFNHVITCVPMSQDSIWLECTSQTVSPGYMGFFTGNRKALLIDSNGGHVVSTPKYIQKNNSQIRNIKAVIDNSGLMKAEINTCFTGLEQEEAHNIIHSLDADEKQKYLNRAVGLPTYSVEKSDYKEIKSENPTINESLIIAAPDFASVTGKRLFIEPNLVNKFNMRFSDEKNEYFR